MFYIWRQTPFCPCHALPCHALPTIPLVPDLLPIAYPPCPGSRHLSGGHILSPNGSKYVTSSTTRRTRTRVGSVFGSYCAAHHLSSSFFSPAKLPCSLELRLLHPSLVTTLWPANDHRLPRITSSHLVTGTPRLPLMPFCSCSSHPSLPLLDPRSLNRASTGP